MPKTGDINNPEGKGGFAENPQNRASGRWDKEQSIPFLQNKLGRMPLEEFESFVPQTPFEKAAWESVKKSYADLGYLKEVTDRTSGKAEQKTDITSQGEKLNITISRADGTESK